MVWAGGDLPLCTTLSVWYSPGPGLMAGLLALPGRSVGSCRNLMVTGSGCLAWGVVLGVE